MTRGRVPVRVSVQLDAANLTGVKLHVVEPRLMLSMTDALKLTEPVGGVGTPVVSVTVTVHVEDWFTTTLVSQLTVVVVVWSGTGLMVIMKKPELGE